MSCYHPLKAFYVLDNNGLPEKTNNNKNKMYITDYKVKYIYQSKNGEWHKSYDDFHSKADFQYSDDFIQIPCGKCLGCRLDQSSMWSNRCMLEASYHASNYFLTITYDEEHVPKTEYTDKETGEIFTQNTLVKRDWQLFIKRLRSELDRQGKPKIRFYMCGEYGTKTLRPHYHAIVFGLELDDLIFYRQDLRGYTLYNSPFLDNLWKKGYITVGQVTPESCSYTARYCTKKAYQDANVFTEHNMEPEFTLMSRKPGIAFDYFNDHPNCFDDEYIYLSTDKGGVKFKPPRYFEKLACKNNELFFLDKQVYAEDNHISDDYKKGVLDDTDLCYLEYLESCEKLKESQIKSLQRPL